MAKQTGIPITLTVDDHAGSGTNISNDVTSVTANSPRGVQDVTGLDKSAMERLQLLSDGQIQINGVFNNDLSHAVFKTIHSFTGTRTVVLDYGTPVLTLECVLTDYSVQRAQDGSLTFTATLQLANGTAPAWS